MSKSEASRFFEDISAGKVVIDASEILGKGSHSDMHEYAKSFGYDFTKEEMLELVNEKGLVGDGEISEEQMEAMAGGANKHKSVVVPVVVGVVVPVTVTASAVAAACL